MRSLAALPLAISIGLFAAGAGFAKSGAESTALRAQGAFVAYDASAETVSVRERQVVRPYAVIPEDTESQVATRVSIEGDSARLEDLEAGSPILVFWRQDPADPTRRVAVSLEVPTIPKSYQEGFR